MAARRTATPLWLEQNLCVVRSGLLVATHEPRPGIRLAEVLFPGDVLGEGSFGGKPPVTLRAVQASKLVVLDGPAVERLFLTGDPAVRWLLEGMASRVRRTERHTWNVRTSPVRARVARFLLDWCELCGSWHLPGPVRGGLSVSLVADLVGSVRPTVHRTLLGFERAGAVVLWHGGITVTDAGALQRRAAGVEPYLQAPGSTWIEHSPAEQRASA